MDNPIASSVESDLLCSFGLGLCTGTLVDGRCRTCRQKSKGQTREEQFGRVNRRKAQFAEAQRIREALVEDPDQRAKTRLLTHAEAAKVWA